MQYTGQSRAVIGLRCGGLKNHMTTVSLEQLAGEKLNGQLHIETILRNETNRVVLSAQADESFVKPGAVAVVVDMSDEPQENFKRYSEARFLDHPHVAHAYLADWLELDGQKHPYVVLDAPDAVLSDLLLAGPLSGPALTDLIRQLLAALAYLHSENLVYGALNVNTIWRVGDRWQLADFSQLRVPGVRPTGETRRLLINREIAAPPEAYYGAIAPAWDIWSLGTLLSKIAKPVRKNGTDKPQPNPVPLPPKLEQILTSASMLEPGDRMPAAEMLSLLAEEKRAASGDARPAPGLPSGVVRLPKHEQLTLQPRAPVEPDAPRRFPWGRTLQVGALAVAVFAASLFLTRRWTDAGSAPSPTPVAVLQPVPERSAAPVLRPLDETKLEVAALLGRWADAARKGDLDAQVNCYAPVVDTYFDRQKLPAVDLRREKERSLEVSGPVAGFNVMNLRFDDIGADWAVVSFDSDWRFGNDNGAEGSAREQVVVRKTNGEWKITSERDVRRSR